jgi:hypothetical protein
MLKNISETSTATCQQQIYPILAQDQRKRKKPQNINQFQFYQTFFENLVLGSIQNIFGLSNVYG